MTDDPAMGPTARGIFFLSYSRSDEQVALRLAKDLRTAGIGIWVDQLDIRPGEQWDRAIERALRECCGLLVVLSPRSVASNNVADEISYAIDAGKSVLPVMIEKVPLPLRLNRMQRVDATSDYDSALLRVREELTRLGGGPKPAAPTAPARRQTMPAAEQESIARQLAPYLGPIATVAVRREARTAGSSAELRERVAALIPDENDRAAFLRAAKA